MALTASQCRLPVLIERAGGGGLEGRSECERERVRGAPSIDHRAHGPTDAVVYFNWN